MSAPFLSVAADRVRVRVRLQPRAFHDRVVGQHGKALKAQVTAPPVGGEANEALECLLARLADLPRSAVRVVGGGKSRDKVVEMLTPDGSSLAVCLERLVSKPGRGSR